MAVTTAVSLILAACALSQSPQDASATPIKVYSRAQIRALAPYGVHLGMDAMQACKVLLRGGFSRHPNNSAGADCAARTPPDEDDIFFGDGTLGNLENKVRTKFGIVFYFSMQYRNQGSRREVSQISIWTNEKDQQDALEAATRAEWGEPTFFAKWGYRVLNYASSPQQADFNNRSDYGSCNYMPACKTPEERQECMGIRKRYASVWMSVTVFDWGRTIEIQDETGSESYKELELIDRDIRAGRLVVACPIPKLH